MSLFNMIFSGIMLSFLFAILFIIMLIFLMLIITKIKKENIDNISNDKKFKLFFSVTIISYAVSIIGIFIISINYFDRYNNINSEFIAFSFTLLFVIMGIFKLKKLKFRIKEKLEKIN